MPYLQRTNLLQKRLLTLTTVGILATAVIVAITVAVPLYQHDKAHYEINLQAMTENRALAIKEYLTLTGQLAMQISSRTFARQKLEQYQAGKLNLTELQTQSLPIFSDAMNKAPEITAITRMDLQGNTLVEAGHTIPSALRPTPSDDIKQKHVISVPVKIATETVILIGTKILNHQHQHIGTEIIAISSRTLAKLQNQRQGLPL